MSDQASTIQVNTIEPQSGTTLTVGQSGQNVVVNADSIKNNVLKDAGGNALFTSNGSGVLSGVNAGFGGAKVLIQTEIASDDTTVEFTSNIDNTYKEYVFEFHGIKASASDPHFRFQCNASGQTGFDETISSTIFRSYNTEGGSPTLGYTDGQDQSEGTAYQVIARNVGTGSDYTCVGSLHLFNPAGTTTVKNFYAETSCNVDYVMQTFAAGFIDSDPAITQVSFNMESGNIAAGTIKMYGIK